MLTTSRETGTSHVFKWGVPVRKFFSDFVFAYLVLGVLCASPAYAYLDSGTISLVLQAVTGAIASALLFGKVYWGKLDTFFSRKSAATGNDRQD